MPSIREVVEQNVFWNRGVGYEWEGQVLMDSSFLAALTNLASQAPKKLVEEFRQDWEEVSEP